MTLPSSMNPKDHRDYRILLNKVRLYAHEEAVLRQANLIVPAVVAPDGGKWTHPRWKETARLILGHNLFHHYFAHQRHPQRTKPCI